MKTQYTDKELEAVEKILAKPVFVGFTEETIRVRRNLLTLAFITIFYTLSGMRIKTFSLLGIGFYDPINEDYLGITIFCLLIYHFCHFLWQSVDAWNECRIRITGTNELYMKNNSNKENINCDFTLDTRQSSLLNWWRDQTSNIITEILVNETERTTANTIRFNDGKPHEIKQLENRLEYLIASVEAINKTINSERTIVSLRRFETFHSLFSWSQILRWYIFEFGIPFFVAIFAMSKTALLIFYREDLNELILLWL